MEKPSIPLSICFIDDDEIYQFTAKRILQMVNPTQKVKVFSNGKEAADFFYQENLSEEDLPDVIFLDINMPVMNGWEFLEAYEKVKDNLKKTSTIYMVSSSVDENDKNRSMKFSAVKDFIVKPINQKMMLDILNASTR